MYFNRSTIRPFDLKAAEAFGGKNGKSLRLVVRNAKGNEPAEMCVYDVIGKERDLKESTLQVRFSLEDVGGLRLKEPKSESGKRQIALPATAVKALWEHKAKLLSQGLAGCPYVFPDAKGGLMRRTNFAVSSWSKVRESAKLEEFHFHDLRHSCASLMLADGVHMKSIQTILGHSTISMTMDTYAHLMPDSQRQAAATFDRLLG